MSQIIIAKGLKEIHPQAPPPHEYQELSSIKKIQYFNEFEVDISPFVSL